MEDLPSLQLRVFPFFGVEFGLLQEDYVTVVLGAELDDSFYLVF